MDDGEITFNYGLPPDGAKQETGSVLGIVPLSPPKGTIPRTPHVQRNRIPSAKVFSVTFPWSSKKCES